MTDPRTGPVTCCRDGVTRHAAIAHLRDPQVTFDRLASDQASHEIYGAILAGNGVDGSAIAWKRRGRCSEIQTAEGPRIRRGFVGVASVSLLDLTVSKMHEGRERAVGAYFSAIAHRGFGAGGVALVLQ